MQPESVIERIVTEFDAGAADDYHVGGLALSGESDTVEVGLDIATGEQVAARAGMRPPHVGSRGRHRGQNFARRDIESGLDKRLAQYAARARSGVGDKAQPIAGGAQCGHGFDRSGQSPPRHGENTVDIQ